MNTIELNACGGRIRHKIKDGDIGGNSQETIIEVTGGQFGCTEIDKIEDGFRLKIIGTWEIGEFLAAMEYLTHFHGEWDLGDIKMFPAKYSPAVIMAREMQERSRARIRKQTEETIYVDNKRRLKDVCLGAGITILLITLLSFITLLISRFN